MVGSAEGRPWVISFSGLDGAGKSTQIENLRQAL
jgi:thymidylate kinase